MTSIDAIHKLFNSIPQNTSLQDIHANNFTRRLVKKAIDHHSVHRHTNPCDIPPDISEIKPILDLGDISETVICHVKYVKPKQDGIGDFYMRMGIAEQQMLIGFFNPEQEVYKKFRLELLKLRGDDFITQCRTGFALQTRSLSRDL